MTLNTHRPSTISKVIEATIEKCAKEKDHADAEEKYEQARNKIVDISCARHLGRPLSQNETPRVPAITKTQGKVKELGGVLPLALEVLLNKAVDGEIDLDQC